MVSYFLGVDSAKIPLPVPLRFRSDSAKICHQNERDGRQQVGDCDFTIIPKRLRNSGALNRFENIEFCILLDDSVWFRFKNEYGGSAMPKTRSRYDSKRKMDSTGILKIRDPNDSDSQTTQYFFENHCRNLSRILVILRNFRKHSAELSKFCGIVLKFCGIIPKFRRIVLKFRRILSKILQNSNDSAEPRKFCSNSDNVLKKSRDFIDKLNHWVCGTTIIRSNPFCRFLITCL